MASPTNVRFPEALDRRLSEFATHRGANKSTVVVRAVEEWLRMQTHPLIYFVTNVLGERRAALVAGPEVWTVAEAWLQNDPADRTPATIAHVTGLGVAQVEAALGYWAEFRAEIDDVMERQHAEADAALAAWERRQELNAL